MRITERFSQHLQRARQTPQACAVLTEAMLWAQQGPMLWRPERVELAPSFYPVYCWQDLYSHSLLTLILHKGRLDVDPAPLEACVRPEFMFWGGNTTLDREIRRVGQAHAYTFRITSADEYAQRLAAALCADIRAAEARHPGHTNVVLCGGKDSLNLLLLPWQNPLLALSAEPNYEIVRAFVAANRLPVEVRRLEDAADADVQDEEALLACCRVDLSHWRWGVHLQRIAQELGPRLLFWKGQLADLYTTPKWKAFHAHQRPPVTWLRKAYKRFGSWLPRGIDHALGHAIQPHYVQSTWDRSAALQGCHMEFLRELTGCLFLSAYHGPSVQQVWCEVDLARAAAADMRPSVGRILAGRDVRYPEQNPAPPVSPFRRQLGTPARFFDLLDQVHFPHSGYRERGARPAASRQP